MVLRLPLAGHHAAMRLKPVKHQLPLSRFRNDVAIDMDGRSALKRKWNHLSRDRKPPGTGQAVVGGMNGIASPLRRKKRDEETDRLQLVIVEGGTPQQTAVLGQSTLFQPPVGGLDAVAKTGSGKPKSFYGSVEVSPATAKMRLVQLAEEIISNLVADPLAELKITVEINANFPNGASDQIRRAVSENAKSLGFKTSAWE
jgi:hypothetical protein